MSLDDLKQFAVEVAEVNSNRFEEFHGENCTDSIMD